MAFSLALRTSPLAFLHSLKARFLPPPAVPYCTNNDGFVRLTAQLPLAGKRPGKTKELPVTATEIGLNKLLFKSDARLIEGEKLDLEMALPGLTTLKLVATVGWVLRSRAQYTGQLALKTTVEQRAVLAEFARLAKSGQDVPETVVTEAPVEEVEDNVPHFLKGL